MKKVVTILLITVYSFATAGTTIAMHYCMGERVSTTMGYEEQNVCEFCHMEKHTAQDAADCCTDDHHFIKVQADQDLASFIYVPQVPVSFISHFLNDMDECSSQKNKKVPTSDQDVVPPDIAVYQLHCNFRI